MKWGSRIGEEALMHAISRGRVVPVSSLTPEDIKGTTLALPATPFPADSHVLFASPARPGDVFNGESVVMCDRLPTGGITPVAGSGGQLMLVGREEALHNLKSAARNGILEGVRQARLPTAMRAVKCDLLAAKLLVGLGSLVDRFSSFRTRG